MSAAGCGLNSAVTGSFQDQYWRRGGEHGLSIRNTAIAALADILRYGLVAIR
jgi:hypothetical protein